jgi:hypothetical protein
MSDQIDYTGTEYPLMMGELRLRQDEPILVRCPNCSRPVEVKKWCVGTDVAFGGGDNGDFFPDHVSISYECEPISCRCDNFQDYPFDEYVRAAIHAHISRDIPEADSFLTEHHNQ